MDKGLNVLSNFSPSPFCLHASCWFLALYNSDVGTPQGRERRVRSTKGKVSLKLNSQYLAPDDWPSCNQMAEVFWRRPAMDPEERHNSQLASPYVEEEVTLCQVERGDCLNYKCNPALLSSNIKYPEVSNRESSYKEIRQ